MAIKEQDTVIRRSTLTKFLVILIRGDWVWLERVGYPGSDPTVLRTSILNDPKEFTSPPPFTKGDRVQYIIGHSNAGTFPGVGTVLCIHEDRAWVYFDGRTVPVSPLMSLLKKAA